MGLGAADKCIKEEGFYRGGDLAKRARTTLQTRWAPCGHLKEEDRALVCSILTCPCTRVPSGDNDAPLTSQGLYQPARKKKKPTQNLILKLRCLGKCKFSKLGKKLFFFFFFLAVLQHAEAPRPGIKPAHSSNHSHSGDARSLTN